MGWGLVVAVPFFCEQLASADMDVAHAGLPNLWTERRRTSRNERSLSSRQHAIVIFSSAENDWSAVAKRAGGSLVRVASIACGIGGVGGRAKRCAQRVLFHVNTARLCEIRVECRVW